MADKDKLSYWELRAALEEQQLHNRGDDYERQIIQAYTQAQQYLTDAANAIYKRYDSQTSLSDSQIKAALNQAMQPADLVALQSVVKSIDDKEAKTKVQEYLNWVAAKNRITKLEELKAKSYIVAKQLADVQLKQSADYYIDAIKDAYLNASNEAVIGTSQNKAGVYDGATVPRVNAETNSIEFISDKQSKPKHASEVELFNELSTKDVKQMLETPWHGSNYSERIWGDTDLLAKKLQELFAVSEMSGMNQQEMALKIAKEFNTGIGVAKRLIRTEANYMHNQGKLAGWRAHGVEYYTLVAIMDFRTSKICREMDGKRFKVDEAQVEVNFPPFHPWCRTVAVAWFSYAKYGGNRTANDPITGKTIKLDADDTYKDWEKILVDKHGQPEVDLARYKVKHYNQDLKQYRQYQEDIGVKNMPKTFDNFQDMKYRNGNDWDMLDLYHNQIGTGKLSPQISFKDYVKLHQLAIKTLVGLKTSDGVQVNSLSKHFMERLIGSSENRRNGVHLSDIKKAFQRGTVESSKKDPTVKLYLSEKLRVTLNAETGKVIQVNPIKTKER